MIIIAIELSSYMDITIATLSQTHFVDARLWVQKVAMVTVLDMCFRKPCTLWQKNLGQLLERQTVHPGNP